MINLGTTTTRQDIKTDEPVRQPAPPWLLLLVIGLYVAVLIAFGQVIYEMRPPATTLVFKAKELEQETVSYRKKNKALKATLKKNKETRAYVKRKEEWARKAVAGGNLIRKTIAKLPPDVKLRGLTYSCQVPGGETPFASVGVTVQVRGTYEAARISSALEKIDPRLAVSSSNQTLTEEGMDVAMEYQYQLNP